MRKTIKKVLSVMLSCILMLSALSVSSFATNEEFLTFELNSDGTGYIVTDCDTSTTGDIVVPQKYNDLPVVEIGYQAFYNCDNLASIIIPNSVTSIGRYAFAECDTLAFITLSEGVVSIDDYAFYNCKKLTSVTIPDSVINFGDSVFSNCTDLTSIEVGSGVANFDYQTVWNCTNLEEINVSENNSVYSSVDGVLFNKNKTTLIKYPVKKNSESYIVPNDVTSIESNAFYKCINITSIVFPDGVTKIPSSCCTGCENLTAISIPDSVTFISDNAFKNTGYYNDLSNWENDVLYINNHLIEAKTSLSGEYKIKEGTRTLTDCAFEGCDGLTSIVIPGTVTKIGYLAFDGCDTLTSVVISDGVTSIGNSAFKKCVALESIKIPDSVTSLGAGAFSGCIKLSTLEIGNNVECIQTNAFYNCDSLTSVVFPDSVTEIGFAAFASCNKLKSVIFGNNLVTIGEQAFYGCPFTSIVIPDSVIDIGEEAFTSCGITEIIIGSNVKTIGKKAFAFCNNLTSIEFKGTPTSVDSATFYGCDSLEIVTFNDTKITSILNYLSFGSSDVITSNSSAMFIGTGDIITVTPSNTQPYSFTTIIKNDVNGDGVADVLDAAYVALCVNDLKEPDEIETLAIDCDNNGEIDVVDYQNLVNVILEA